MKAHKQLRLDPTENQQNYVVFRINSLSPPRISHLLTLHHCLKSRLLLRGSSMGYTKEQLLIRLKFRFLNLLELKTAKAFGTVKNVKDKSAVGSHQRSFFSDAELLVEEILNKTSGVLLSEIKEDSIRQHGEHLGTVVVDSIRKHLSSDLKNPAIMYKNTAYAQGFYAGTHHHPKQL